MKIETIFSQGTSRYREDGFFVNPPFFGVVDGLSAPHNPIKEGPLRFNGLTGGEMVRRVVLETFYSASADLPLEEALRLANWRVGKIQKERGIPIWRSDLLAGVSFVCLKIEEENLKIIQAADCFAAWVFASGETGITKSQIAYSYGLEIRDIIARLMAKCGYDRNLIWDEFIPIISMQRYRDVNKQVPTGYALLNGQDALLECWQELEVPAQDLKFVILFSDGFVPFEDMSDEQKMARDMIALYKRAGLGGILDRKRADEEVKSKESHIAQTEATAVAIEFGG